MSVKTRGYIVQYGSKAKMWVKIHPRHGIAHLVLPGRNVTVCGISLVAGSYMVTGREAHCAQCAKNEGMQEALQPCQ
jgi:hypothetical protein